MPAWETANAAPGECSRAKAGFASVSDRLYFAAGKHDAQCELGVQSLLQVFVSSSLSSISITVLKPPNGPASNTKYVTINGLNFGTVLELTPSAYASGAFSHAFIS